MSILPLQIARVSNLLNTTVTQQSLTQLQQQLMVTQNQLTTGKKVNAPSDDPSASGTIMQLQKTLEVRQGYSTNISQASSQLGQVDSSLGDLTNLLTQAQSIASANVGSDVTADQRSAAADQVQSLYNEALSIANKQSNGAYLFGGDQSNTAPYIATSGGVQFVGSNTVLQNQVDQNTSVPIQVSAQHVFGSYSSDTQGTADLTPRITAQSQLSDMRGATSNGIKLSTIVLGNGAVTKSVDLSQASSIGDVMNAINAAGVGGITASINAAGNGLTLAGTAGDNITVSETAGGTTAASLGILTPTGAGPGATVIGSSINPFVSSLTPLSELRGGTGIDTAGLTITNGSTSAAIALTSPPLRANPTVSDLLNAINGSDTGVTARINAAGNGIDVLNATQGTSMRIAENGGTTAADLGIQSFSANTPLANLNGGKGVSTVTGADMSITRSDGTSFTVDIDGATTVQDVINRINSADTSGGLNPPGVVASFSTVTNSLVLTDVAGGGSTVAVNNANGSNTVADLGLDSAASGTVITGKDVNPIQVSGVFSDLAKLQSALRSNDQSGITDSGSALQLDQQNVIDARGQEGAIVQDLQTRQSTLDNENTATQSLLSTLQDTDFTTAITQFQQLQTNLQAALETAGQTLNLSLLNFLQ